MLAFSVTMLEKISRGARIDISGHSVFVTGLFSDTRELWEGYVSSGEPTIWSANHWAAISEVLPGFLMDWIYDRDGAFRLKHHNWMITRPSFISFAKAQSEAIAEKSDLIIQNCSSSTDFPKGEQTRLAIRFFQRLGEPNAAHVSMFLTATACEMIGATPFNAFKEPELAAWIKAAQNEKVESYGNVLNIYANVLSQVMLWIVACMPLTALNKRIAGRLPNISADIMIGFIPDSDHRRTPHDNYEKLRKYTDSIYHMMARLGSRSPTPRSYREFEE